MPTIYCLQFNGMTDFLFQKVTRIRHIFGGDFESKILMRCIHNFFFETSNLKSSVYAGGGATGDQLEASLG